MNAWKASTEASVPVPADFLAHCVPLGDIGTGYLRDHYARFVRTRQQLLLTWKPSRNARVLDVGAHWLHQAVLYAIDGFAITALDLPATLDLPEVRALANLHGIQLVSNPDLECPTALGSIADDTFDIVLFTEIIEHLAFNPIRMWREIHRVMKPGARIVITTPNYYGLRSRTRGWLRAIRLLGAGVDVEDILAVRTLGHHWKEYSRRELIRYFTTLSADFSCRNLAYTEEYHPAFLANRRRRLVRWLERLVPPLRPDIYLEVELVRKDKGIVIEPHW
jgi:2-polyprenyl-6-hydroxyphenyl methylase/3-demethylubiquinone-9 3-methyltransferase